MERPTCFCRNEVPKVRLELAKGRSPTDFESWEGVNDC